MTKKPAMVTVVKPGVDLMKLFWSKFTHTFLKTRPFHKLK